MEALLKQRDKTLRTWGGEHPGEDIFEDRRQDIASQMPISVEATLHAMEKEVADRSSDFLI